MLLSDGEVPVAKLSESRSRRSQWLIAIFVSALAVSGHIALAQTPIDAQTAFAHYLPTVGPSKVSGQSRTLLPDGSWLLIGGPASGVANDAIAIEDDSSDQPVVRVLPAKLAQPLIDATATLLADGTVFIFGGSGPDGKSLNEAELFDPQTQVIQVLPDPGLTARSRHTATLLTSGLVLLAGGTGTDGTPVELSELYDPSTQKAQPFVAALETPRTDHQAALLSNGKGLLWGGKDASGQPLSRGELYDPTLMSFMGIDWWDSLLPAKELSDMPPQIAESLPQNAAKDAPVDTRVAVRFTEPLKVHTVNSSTVTLVGPSGAVEGKVVPAESGLLSFFTPRADLSPATTYTLFLNGVTDNAGRYLPFSSFSFTTQRIPATPADASGPGSVNIKITQPMQVARTAPAKSAAKIIPKVTTSTGPISGLRETPGKEDKKITEDDDGNEDWLPSEQNRHGKWQVLGLQNDPVMHATSVTRLVAAKGVSALSGQVARLNGKPLAGVPVNIGGHASITDKNGQFLIDGIDAGIQTLKVDGTAVVSSGRHYTKHFIQVELAKGTTTTMPNTIYLPRVDTATEVNIASPMDQDMVLTHPAIPGLEVHVPKGAVLREYDGKIVTKLSITPIPIDRAPYAAPIDFSVYFTLQPGGAFVDGDPDKAVKIIYPNYQGLPAGSSVDFWNYDPNGGGWKVYGQGVVSPDGKKILPNNSVGFRQVMTFGYGIGGSGSLTPAANGPVPCGCTQADPVDLATGLFTHTVTDMAVPDVMPITVTRTYRQNDSTSRVFGYGNNISYQMYLCPPASGGTTCSTTVSNELDLILSDSGRIHFILQSGSFSGYNGVWTNTDSDSPFHGAVLAQSPTGSHDFTLTTRDGTVMVFSPHAPNQLQSITDRNGNTVTLSFPNGGVSGNIAQITSPNGRYIQLSYDSSNRVTLATDNIGRTVHYTYDSTGRLSTVADMDNNVETYGYTDSADPYRMTSITDRRNNLVTQNTFDSSGRLQKQTLADGTYWQFAYQLDSTNTYINLTTVTDPRGYQSQYSFNASGYTTQEVLAQGQPEQQTLVYSRTSTNLVQSMTDALGRVTAYAYDSYGDVTSVTRLSGTSSAETDTFAYDPNYHQLSSHTDGLNHTTSFNRDSHGNLSTIVDALGNTTQITNNGQGLPTQISDPLSHASVISYQQADISSITDPLSRTVSIFTDAVGRPIGVTNPLGYQTQYSYDNMNRLLQVIDPQNGATAMTYDANGNLNTFVDPRQAGTHQYNYDARNRIQTYIDPLNASESYSFDGLNNLTQHTDRKNQTTSYQYDGLNRVKLITYQDGSTIQISWDAGNRPKQAVDSANGTISWTFDQLDRLTAETTPQGSVIYPVYDAADRLKQMVVNNGTAINYTYDNANRMTGVSQGSAAVAVGYDNASRRNLVTLPNGVTMTYGYDNPGNDLQSIAYASGSTSLGSITYGYDSNGRINARNSTIDQTGVPTTTGSATAFNSANQLTTLGTRALTYDANGNLTNDGVNSYAWNARNQLISMSGSVNATFAYDAVGRRQARSVNSTYIAFVYDGANLVQELASGGGTQASYLTGRGIDETFSRTDSSSTQSYLTDLLGSTVGLSNSAGTITTGYSYDAYGNTATTGGTSLNPLQYAGRENDQTGLYYNRTRYYNPAIQRFISQDPIGLNGGANVYAYVRGNPISRIDPYGLWDVFGFGSLAVETPGPVRMGFEGIGLAGYDSNSGGYIGDIFAKGYEIGGQSNYVAEFNGCEHTSKNPAGTPINIKEANLGFEIPFLFGAGIGAGKYTMDGESGYFLYLHGGWIGDHGSIGIGGHL